jgi:uncharacterized protein
VDRALVVLIGLPGSGKTSLARWLADHSVLSIVSRDAIRSAMFPVCAYSVDEKAAAYSSMKLAIAVNLALGRSVCTDGITFANQDDREDMAELAREAGALLVLVYCECPVNIAQDRIASDTQTVFPDRNAATVTEVASRMSPVPPEAYRLDMTKPMHALGPELAEHLSIRLAHQ